MIGPTRNSDGKRLTRQTRLDIYNRRRKKGWAMRSFRISTPLARLVILMRVRLAPGNDLAIFDSDSADPVKKSEVGIRKFVARQSNSQIAWRKGGSEILMVRSEPKPLSDQ